MLAHSTSSHEEQYANNLGVYAPLLLCMQSKSAVVGSVNVVCWSIMVYQVVLFFSNVIKVDWSSLGHEVGDGELLSTNRDLLHLEIAVMMMLSVYVSCTTGDAASTMNTRSSQQPAYAEGSRAMSAHRAIHRQVFVPLSDMMYLASIFTMCYGAQAESQIANWPFNLKTDTTPHDEQDLSNLVIHLLITISPLYTPIVIRNSLGVVERLFFFMIVIPCLYSETWCRGSADPFLPSRVNVVGNDNRQPLLDPVDAVVAEGSDEPHCDITEFFNRMRGLINREEPLASEEIDLLYQLITELNSLGPDVLKSSIWFSTLLQRQLVEGGKTLSVEDKKSLHTIVNNVEKIFICPISQAVMTEPVTNLVGTTYEKVSILEWFKTKLKDPVTGQALASNSLTPNHELTRLKAFLGHLNSKKTRIPTTPSEEDATLKHITIALSDVDRIFSEELAGKNSSPASEQRCGSPGYLASLKQGRSDGSQVRTDNSGGAGCLGGSEEQDIVLLNAGDADRQWFRVVNGSDSETGADSDESAGVATNSVGASCSNSVFFATGSGDYDSGEESGGYSLCAAAGSDSE